MASRVVASSLVHHFRGCIHLDKWLVKASVQGEELWGQFGRVKKLQCAENEDGQKDLDATLRNGEGKIGLQGCRMGENWEK